MEIFRRGRSILCCLLYEIAVFTPKGADVLGMRIYDFFILALPFTYFSSSHQKDSGILIPVTSRKLGNLLAKLAKRLTLQRVPP